MNHQPFEDWLLEDRQLSKEQGRELQAHLRICTSCSAIADSNRALHAPRWIKPRPGFAHRFSVRLERLRKRQTAYQAIGTFVLVLSGVALLYALAGNAAGEWLLSPATAITTITGYFVVLLSLLHVMGEIFRVLVWDVPRLIPIGGWILMVMSAMVVTAIWAAVVRRLARVPQGA
jgi:hypothetical protein